MNAQLMIAHQDGGRIECTVWVPTLDIPGRASIQLPVVKGTGVTIEEAIEDAVRELEHQVWEWAGRVRMQVDTSKEPLKPVGVV